MQFLKILYICWVVFWAFGCILGGVMGHNATFGGMLYVFLLLIFLPLLPYFLYLLHNKIIQAKNALNRLFFYLTFFFVFVFIVLYYLNFIAIIFCFMWESLSCML